MYDTRGARPRVYSRHHSDDVFRHFVLMEIHISGFEVAPPADPVHVER
ncbi:hypothetical protein [Geodermatophilus amargosae]|nr:hypothetical protein [Geodermatophilus amargosae]